MHCVAAWIKTLLFFFLGLVKKRKKCLWWDLAHSQNQFTTPPHWRGALSPLTCPPEDRLEFLTLADSNTHKRHTNLTGTLWFSHKNCKTHKSCMCQVSIEVVMLFFCGGWSWWPDENVILHYVLNGSGREFSEGWGDSKETHSCCIQCWNCIPAYSDCFTSARTCVCVCLC